MVLVVAFEESSHELNRLKNKGPPNNSMNKSAPYNLNSPDHVLLGNIVFAGIETNIHPGGSPEVALGMKTNKRLAKDELSA